MKHAPPQHQRATAKPAARRPGPAPMRKAAMGRPYGLNHISIGPMETGLEAQAHGAANRVVRGDKGVAHDLTPAPAASVAVPSHGQPLPPMHRAWLEPAFGADLGAVRVHHGPEAAAAARAEHAHAFTAGRDIYFGQGQFDPHVQEGRHLLAHEVAHVLQQTAVSGPAHRPTATDATGPGEVQRARSAEEKPIAAVAPPCAMSVHAPSGAMPDAVHHASGPVTRTAMSPAATKPLVPPEAEQSRKRRGRLP